MRGGKIEEVEDYKLHMGYELATDKSSISFWNYDYFFKTKAFTKKEYFRFSKAYQRYFGEWKFGSTEEEAFEKFMKSIKSKWDRAPYNALPESHPKYIRKAVNDLTPEQLGLNAWGYFDK